MSHRILSVRACDVTALLISERVNPIFLWERECTGGLLVSVLKVFKDSIKDFVGGYCVVIIKMIIHGCFFMNVKSFHSVEMNTFFWNCIIFIILCMFPKECMCFFECCAYFEAWLLYWKECLCSLNLVMKSLPVCPMYGFSQSGKLICRCHIV